MTCPAVSRFSRSNAHGSGPRYAITPVPFDGILHGVNDAGEFAGQHPAPDGAQHAVHVRASDVIDLGTLGGSSSFARAINNDAVIVGGALTQDDEEHHAFVYVGGVMYDLNDCVDAPDFELLYALGVNTRGDIVAIAHHEGHDCVVLLTPQPLVADGIGLSDASGA